MDWAELDGLTCALLRFSRRGLPVPVAADVAVGALGNWRKASLLNRPLLLTKTKEKHDGKTKTICWWYFESKDRERALIHIYNMYMHFSAKVLVLAEMKGAS